MTSYKEAGVDVEKGQAFVERLKKLNPDIGGFSGLYPFGENYLVGSCDGVGTKLKLAFQTGRHETVGIDLVAMCVNDILTTGATPLFFMDYFATGGLDLSQAEAVLSGVMEGCRQAKVQLLGGETAEMPGFYAKGEYDLAGFALGVVEKKRLVDGSKISEGDPIYAYPSSGLHSNGFSLVRKLLDDGADLDLQTLLTPTKIYTDSLPKEIKGAAHITGGGFFENIPRMLQDRFSARIDRSAWEVPQIFQEIQKAGQISDKEMFSTFNMGIGMVYVGGSLGVKIGEVVADEAHTVYLE